MWLFVSVWLCVAVPTLHRCRSSTTHNPGAMPLASPDFLQSPLRNPDAMSALDNTPIVSPTSPSLSISFDRTSINHRATQSPRPYTATQSHIVQGTKPLSRYETLPKNLSATMPHSCPGWQLLLTAAVRDRQPRKPWTYLRPFQKLRHMNALYPDRSRVILIRPCLQSQKREVTAQEACSSLHMLRRCPPLCDIPSGYCFFTGPWTVTRSSRRMLRRVAAFCRPLRPVLLLVSFPRSRSPVVGVLGLC